MCASGASSRFVGKCEVAGDEIFAAREEDDDNMDLEGWAEDD